MFLKWGTTTQKVEKQIKVEETCLCYKSIQPKQQKVMEINDLPSIEKNGFNKHCKSFIRCFKSSSILLVLGITYLVYKTWVISLAINFWAIFLLYLIPFYECPRGESRMVLLTRGVTYSKTTVLRLFLKSCNGLHLKNRVNNY